jgi:hypothetical protein
VLGSTRALSTLSRSPSRGDVPLCMGSARTSLFAFLGGFSGLLLKGGMSLLRVCILNGLLGLGEDMAA